jgi:hypothetical protein
VSIKAPKRLFRRCPRAAAGAAPGRPAVGELGGEGGDVGGDLLGSFPDDEVTGVGVADEP